MLELKIKKKIEGDCLFVCDLQLNNGLYLISGENGSGKTTLFNILAKYDDDYDGQVLLNGINIEDVDTASYRNKNVCYFLQEVELFEELTCIQNMEILIEDIDESKLEQILYILDFKTIYNSKKKVSKLSGGEKQKLSIVINLFRKCDLYLLDEIENNLDQATKEKITELLIPLEGIVLIISHNPIYYEKLNPKIIEITDKEMKLIDDQTDIGNHMSNDSEWCNKNTLNKSDFKLLSKYNQYNRILIGFIILLMMFALSIVASNILLVSQYLVKPQDNFNEGINLVSPPQYSPYYDSLGNESWLSTTAYNFTEENLSQLEQLDYVDEVIPIAESAGYAGSSALYRGEETFFYEVSDDFNKLDYAKYGMDEYVSSQIVESNIVNILFPQSYYKNTPYTTALNIDSLLYGDYPQDESNEILISQYTAIKVAMQMKLRKLDELIGKDVTVSLKNTETKNQKDFNFKISGIYELNKRSGSAYTENPIYVAYSTKDEIVQRNNCSLYKDDQQENKDICLKISAGIPIDQDITEEQRIEIGDYSQFYVKVDSEDSEKKLVKDLKQYDPYIYVDSNYSRSQATSFIFVKQKIINSVLLIFLTLLIFSLLLFGIYKLFILENYKINKVLNHFGFSEETYADFIDLEFKKAKLASMVILLGLQLGYAFLFELSIELVVFTLLLDLLIYFILNIILKGRSNGKKNSN